jgi:hypothetical protein
MKRIVLAVLVLFFSFALCFGGVEWKTKSETQGQGKGQSNKIVMQCYAQKGDVKQVFEQVEKEDGLFAVGSCWLFKSADNVLYLVNPKEKTYSELPFNSIFKMVGVMGKIVKIKVSNPEVKLEKLGKETVLGFACNHYKMVVDYDMEMKIVLIKSKGHEHIEKEVWAAPQVKALTEMGEAFRYRDFKTGMEDLDNLIETQMKAESNLGFPLKTISVTTSIDKKGKSKEKSRMTQEVLSLSTRTLPASTFEIPADYKKRDIGKSDGE